MTAREARVRRRRRHGHGWPNISCQNPSYKLIIPGGSSPYFGPANVPSGSAPTPVPVTGLHCTVPKLRGKTLSAAKTRLKSHDCRLGRVKTRKSSGRAGRVLSQSPAAGKTLPDGSKVSVTVGRRR